MDYNIKFKYEGVTKPAVSIASRQRAIQAQRSIEKESMGGVSKESARTIDLLKKISQQMDQMIFVLKSISSGQQGFVAGGGGGGGGFGGQTGGVSSKFKAMITGAGVLGAMGWGLHKINEVGNAYIERMSAQATTVGLGGFRTGQGMYNAASMAAGMKEYARASGKFAGDMYFTKQYQKDKKGNLVLDDKGKPIPIYDYLHKPNKTALDVGAVYGLSAEETLGTAGKFTRAGAQGMFEKTVHQAMGMGIQSDLPLLLKGMTDSMEEAVRAGLDASDMASDMGKSIAAIALNAPGKSIDTALNIMRAGAGTKAQVARGQFGSLEGIYGARAGQETLMQQLTGEGREKRLENLLSSGFISADQKKKIEGLAPGTDFQTLLKTVGAPAAYSLMKKTTAEMSPAEFELSKVKQIQKQWGNDAESQQRFLTTAQSMGFTHGVGELNVLWKAAKGGGPVDMTKMGEELLKARAGGVQKSGVGLSVQREQMQEHMIFSYGAKFADTSIKMEQALLKMAEKAAPLAITAIEKLSNIVGTLSDSFGQLGKQIDLIKGSSGVGDAINKLRSDWGEYMKGRSIWGTKE